jgi:ER lumen protein retaining receptor
MVVGYGLLSLAILTVFLSFHSCFIGISVHSLELFLLCYCARYVDIFVTYCVCYDSMSKVFIVTSITVILLMIRYNPQILHDSYDTEYDTNQFCHMTVLCGCIILLGIARLVETHYWVEVFSAFSLSYEAIAIIAQVQLIQTQQHNIKRWVLVYVALLGTYRGFHLLDYIYVGYNHAWYQIDIFQSIYRVIDVIVYILCFYNYFVDSNPSGTDQNVEETAKQDESISISSGFEYTAIEKLPLV